MSAAAALTYRWIIVGAGAAGCWLARRLAAAGCGRVALVEAGPASRDVRLRVPAWYPRVQKTSLDWGFSTAPQAGLNRRQISWPRGRVVGGSSATNALIYMLPSASDLRRWSRCVGSHWQACIDEVCSQERLIGARARETMACPITGLPLENAASIHPWHEAILQVLTDHGLKREPAWLQAETNICGAYSVTRQHGRRTTHAHTILERSSRKDLSTLTLFANCQVERLIIERGRAVGLECHVGASGDSPRQLLKLMADESIILSAGTLGSPQLLMHSGIGPAQMLEEVGLPVVVNAPHVGEHLQDHLVMPIILQTKSQDGLPARFSPDMRQLYRQHGSGPMASNIAEVGAMISSKKPTKSPQNETTQDSVQWHMTRTHYLRYPWLSGTDDCLSIGVTPLHPQSRGRLKLLRKATSDAATNNDRFALEIDAGYLTEEGDVQAMLDAVEQAIEIASNSQLRTTIDSLVLPSPKRLDRASLQRSIQMFSQSIYHPTSTCRAGDDDQSVVDEHFRVRGIDALRIADASVLPDLPGANTCAAAMLVAEMAARSLLGK